MSTAINQHYIPQFLLKNFQVINKKGNESAIFIFDKQTSREYRSAIKTTAAERYFYEVKAEQYTIEDKLGEYECITGPIIKDILEKKSIKRITRKEKTILTKFICLQLLRVPAMRSSFFELTKVFEEKFNFFEESGISKPTSDEEKITHCDFILNNVALIFPFVYNKDWMLCESNSGNYIIGDNPVVLNNTLNKEQGNLGIASNGVEIYLPISPKYCLLLICNSVRKDITQKLDALPLEARQLPFAIRANKFLNELRRRETIKSSEENVTFSNSLQVLSAERFVYSHEQDFTLPNEIVAENGNDSKRFRIY